MFYLKYVWATLRLDFLVYPHHYSQQIHVEEGVMTCPNCKHEYPISNGIPNMVSFGLSRIRISAHRLSSAFI